MSRSTVLAVCAVVGSVTSVSSADVVTDWNQIALDAVRTSIGGSATPPPRASRNLAMVHAAVYDAVNAIDRSHLPYRFGPTSSNPNGAQREAAAVAAAHRVLVGLYPTLQGTFDTARTNSLAGLPATGRAAGEALGDDIAGQMLGWRSTDGSTAPSTYQPTNPPVPGRWQPTPPANAAAHAPQWGAVTPFAINNGAQFRPPAPPALNSQAWADGCNQARDLGSATSGTRTPDQTNIARAWAFGGGTITPPGSWNQIARDLGGNQGNTVSQNARLFAMLNVASADAAIACWEAKYHFDFWRPITAIRAGDTDGNAGTVQDAVWTPLLTTPNFPSHTSGHSTFSRASATILQQFFGTDALNFTLISDGGVPNRSFTSLDAAANEAGLSRIYGGIHFSFENVGGQACGQQIADWVRANYFQVPAPGAGLGLAMAGMETMARRRRV